MTNTTAVTQGAWSQRSRLGLSVLSVLITKEFAEVKAFHTSVGKMGGT